MRNVGFAHAWLLGVLACVAGCKSESKTTFIVFDAGAKRSKAETKAERAQLACVVDRQVKACIEAAGYFATGSEGAAKDPNMVLEMSRHACELGDGDTCEDIGDTYSNGRIGRMRDPAAALKAYELGCRHKHLASCDRVALLHERDGYIRDAQDKEIVIIPRDVQRAARSFAELCDSGYGLSCLHLSEMYWNGTEATPANPQKRLELAIRGCDLGSATACAELATYYEDDDDVKPSPEKALASRTRACELRRTDRESSPLRMTFASGGPFEFMAHDCLGAANALLGQPDGVERALKLLEHACQQRVGKVCYRLAELFAEGKVVKVDKTRATAELRRGCDAGYEPACRATIRE